MLTRGWDQLVDRVGGPMTLRLLIQPAVAIFLAIRGRGPRRQGPLPGTRG